MEPDYGVNFKALLKKLIRNWRYRCLSPKIDWIIESWLTSAMIADKLIFLGLACPLRISRASYTTCGSEKYSGLS